MADDRKNSPNDLKSPLERYLEKQKAEKAAAAAREAKPAAAKKPGLFAKAEAQAQAFANSKLSQKAPPPPPVDPRANPYAKGEKPSLHGIERPEPVQPPTLSRWEKVAESRLSEDEQRAQEAGAPPAPPRSNDTPPVTYSEAAPPPEAVHVDQYAPITDSSLQPDGLENADFGIRFLAAMVDGMIFYAFDYAFARIMPTAMMSGLIHLLAVLGFIFAYYGYFYSVKGATPGKLLLNLQVTTLDGKTLVSPGKAFFREAIGKTISFIPFLMGYIIVLIRQDHRALHDLLFDTRVVRRRP